MTPADIHSDTVIPSEWRVFGWRLQPFTLGHARVLSAMGIGDGGFTDGIITAMICSRSGKQAVQWLKNPLLKLLLKIRCIVLGWQIKRQPPQWLKEQEEALELYIKHHTTAPTVHIDGGQRSSDTPLWEAVLVAIMMDLGLSEKEACMMPVNKALMWYYVAAENKGLCSIVDTDKHTRQADEMEAMLRENPDILKQFESVNG